MRSEFVGRPERGLPRLHGEAEHWPTRALDESWNIAFPSLLGRSDQGNWMKRLLLGIGLSVGVGLILNRHQPRPLVARLPSRGFATRRRSRAQPWHSWPLQLRSVARPASFRRRSDGRNAIEVDGVRLHYVDRGKGSNALRFGRPCWTLAPQFERRYLSHRCDMPPSPAIAPSSAQIRICVGFTSPEKFRNPKGNESILTDLPQ